MDPLLPAITTSVFWMAQSNRQAAATNSGCTVVCHRCEVRNYFLDFKIPSY